jgi:hypothetical protein
VRFDKPVDPWQTAHAHTRYGQWLYLGFPLGFIGPIILYQLHKRYPHWSLDKVAIPLICNGANTIPQ